MAEFGTPASPNRGGPVAGLVLLYAENFAELPPVWLLDKERLTIGRDEGTDVRMNVNAVSRVHAEVGWENDAWVLRDRGSRNGTLVDGRRITAVELEPLNEVRIGDAILKFVDKHAEAFADYRIDGAMRPGAARRGPSDGAMIGGYQIDRIAADLGRIAPTPLSVMLLGESGTGKEVVARELHRLSGRRGAFSAVNCAAIPATLIESELFGYKRGAFSGADRDKPGLIKSAHEGTLLLDEIGDMPLEAQAKLLRVLQAKEVFPLGATAPERVDVRVICATHRDLWRLQQGGAFRQDLFARLNEYQLRLPALRERKEDVFMLVRAFLDRHGRQELTPSFGFMTAALQYDWPYNVRELEACIKRCVALAESTVLGDQLLPAPVIEAMEDYGDALRPGGSTAPGSLPPPPASYEPPSKSQVPTDAELRALLEQHGGNVAAVGRQLGKARMQVHRWMKRFGIHVDDFRRG
ncbi:MAG: sigma-54-dependent Fis family transcriptional regulator [Sorangiineae bacterium PRO1]|nr:sigma-54-dependent Fis family transcriptional regulator [Sorangiineae bacterium PRO1]